MLKTHGWCAAVPLTLTLSAGRALGGVGDPPAAPGADEDVYKLLGGPAVDAGGTGARGGFDSENVTLHAWIALNQFSGGSSRGNDCWGYVSPSGREYAIMGLERGFGFVEVTDPDSPVIVGVIPGPASTWHDVKVIGHYAYGVSEAGSGIQVIDMSQIDSGTVTLVRNKVHQGHSTTHNIAANPESGYLYLCGGNIQNGGLVAVDTTTPDDPTIVGAWGQMYVHDAQIVTYTEGPYAGREIAFCFSGFDSGWSQTGLRIVDVTDKSNMFTISTVSWAGASYSHQGWLSEDRKYLYIDDELDEYYGHHSTTTTHVFNVEDLTDPVFQGTFTSGRPSIDHNQYTHKGRIYQANYRSGLRVFEYSDPMAPTQIAYFDSYPENDGIGFDGAWSTYPYFPSGTVLISDINRGLFIVSLDVCAADFNGDETVNTQDVLAFLNAWTAGDSSADVNGDGTINTQDVLAFLNLWTAGC
ncbi:MAG TPA: choice-of-anchor B family protein [Phycisphaerales bacterium]|nr:choice-of-anchor B family protein [Phycisphaerales bacterium]